ncbi:5,6-dimethylbenzimidazole synthase [Kiloniella laminariae]|uniref:5,6-dimethylbenzimidazole synthase n=1 Tax=Kiloniella laminariae TaxID=454162 RepID=A0ABT4LSM9_9PROT|nr:5,6-dimethylbenzimidazole synthase [Kiloniella laminariae]MCZ4282942.1 5,6-dimethylbenzimidazole synthase [Kiloniella laminariae]
MEILNNNTVIADINSSAADRQGAVSEAFRFSDGDRRALYQTIFSRRDVRGQFLQDSIPESVLSRVLMAAHYAPSVGFMQPWNFVVIKSGETKQQVRRLFDKAHNEAAEMFPADKREVYRNLKLEGILEAPINICITCDKQRAGPVVVGRTHIPEMDVYSSVCAVQNLWLAARAEGLGLGWVSILDPLSLKELLEIPEGVVPVAYICLGYVSRFFDKPELQSAGWRPRLPLAELVNFERYGRPAGDDSGEKLLARISSDQQELETKGYQPGFVSAE